MEPGGLASIISITDSRHEAGSSSTKVYPPRCFQLHKLSSWFPVPYVVRGKLTGEGGMALSGGGVGGAGPRLSGESRGGTSLAKPWLRIHLPGQGMWVQSCMPGSCVPQLRLDLAK